VEGESLLEGKSVLLKIPHEKIAVRAYEKWCQRGCPPGTDAQDWMEAEAELRFEQGQRRKG